MSCEDVRRAIPLVQYGEISFDEEEAVHAHLGECAACREEFARYQALDRALESRELEPSPYFVRTCREDLSQRLDAERARGARHGTWWEGLKAAFTGAGLVPSFARPVGAVALVAMGFFGARFTPMGGTFGTQSAGVLDPGSARVRYIEPGPSGRVQVVVDETRQRVISGQLDDARIRSLLVAAAKDPSDPGLRGESVEILKNRPDSDEIRKTLLHALQHDTNDGVRLKALEGLKRFATEPDVRKALSQVLLTDANPGLRIQAVDLLTQQANEGHVVGVLQEIVRKEENQYIRLQCERALRGMKASVDTY